jgi:stage II sporulation protein AB (anti-sigma F factor)
LGSSDKPLDLQLTPVPRSVAFARAAASRLAADCGVSAIDVALCVSEAVTNAVVHAFRDRKDGSGAIRVHGECHGDGILWVSVEDDGVGVAPPRSDSPGLGLGLGMIATVAWSLEVSSDGGGSRVRMGFRAHP